MDQDVAVHLDGELDRTVWERWDPAPGNGYLNRASLVAASDVPPTQANTDDRDNDQPSRSNHPERPASIHSHDLARSPGPARSQRSQIRPSEPAARSAATPASPSGRDCQRRRGRTLASPVRPDRLCVRTWPRPTHQPAPRLRRWLSGKPLTCRWLCGAAVPGLRRGVRCQLSQPVSAAIQWLWSFIRLCVAATSRHSDNAAVRPRRWKRLILRLNLICANTGSTVDFRCL